MDNPLNIINNEARLRFETKLEEEYAYVEYRWHRGDIVFMHTFVPDEGRGKGISSQLAHFVLEYVKDQGLKMKVYCPFINTYLLKHPEYNELLSS